MNLVIFGLSISSSWGNGHATLWRGLLRALAARGHRIVFFERDQPYYALHRDLWEPAYAELRLYPGWAAIREEAARETRAADVVIVTSFCADGIAATDLLCAERKPLRVFYDLDTPVTLEKLGRGERVDHIGPRGLRDFDLALSFTGGETLRWMQRRLLAPAVEVLYGSVDPEVHKPVAPSGKYSCDLSYLGTYAEDRQEALEQLFLEPARRLAEKRFLLGGALYPANFPWTDNIYFVRHVPPTEHAEFYCSSRMTLNVTRGAMASAGFCPSGRLFEAAACGVPILTDWWNGLDHFFQPGKEILVAGTAAEAVAAMRQSPESLAGVGTAARARVLAEHTAERRAEELEFILRRAREAAPRLRRGLAASGVEWHEAAARG